MEIGIGEATLLGVFAVGDVFRELATGKVQVESVGKNAAGHVTLVISRDGKPIGDRLASAVMRDFATCWNTPFPREGESDDACAARTGYYSDSPGGRYGTPGGALRARLADYEADERRMAERGQQPLTSTYHYVDLGSPRMRSEPWGDRNVQPPRARVEFLVPEPAAAAVGPARILVGDRFFASSVEHAVVRTTLEKRGDASPIFRIFTAASDGGSFAGADETDILAKFARREAVPFPRRRESVEECAKRIGYASADAHPFLNATEALHEALRHAYREMRGEGSPLVFGSPLREMHYTETAPTKPLPRTEEEEKAAIGAYFEARRAAGWTTAGPVVSSEIDFSAPVCDGDHGMSMDGVHLTSAGLTKPLTKQEIARVFFHGDAKRLFCTDPRVIAIESRLAEPGVTKAARLRRIWEVEETIREECLDRARRMGEVEP